MIVHDSERHNFAWFTIDDIGGKIKSSASHLKDEARKGPK